MGKCLQLIAREEVKLNVSVILSLGEPEKNRRVSANPGFFPEILSSSQFAANASIRAR